MHVPVQFLNGYRPLLWYHTKIQNATLEKHLLSDYNTKNKERLRRKPKRRDSHERFKLDASDRFI